VNTPIIGSEGLLRLARLVERLRLRDLDEGGVSWMTHARTFSLSPAVHADGEADGEPGGGAVGVVAGGETAGGCPDAEYVAGAVGDCARPGDLSGDRRERR
jgi:hypothetical protein